jgi:transposase
VLSVSLKRDKIEYRAVIKFFVKEGLPPNGIHSKFIKVYGDCSSSFSKIKKWAAEFKRSRNGLEDDPREGRPKNATTPEIIEQVHDTSTHVLHIAAVGNTIYKTKVSP